MQPGQSYPEWVALLRGLPKDCRFECKSEACNHISFMEEQIRDVVLQYTPHAEIRRQFLSGPNISLKDVLTKADLYIRTLETEQILTDRGVSVNKITAQYKKNVSKQACQYQ